MDLVRVLPQLHMFRFRVGQAYLWSDGAGLTLIDAGPPGAAREIAEGVRSLGLDPARIGRIVLTHCHEDHFGGALELAREYGARVLAHRLDAPVVRGEQRVAEPVLLDWEIPLRAEAVRGLTPASPTPVDQELEDGDELDFGDGARVVHTPGHTPGGCGFHLARHGVLFTGDCVAGTGGVRLGVFNIDREQTKASMRRLAVLAPSTVCFGHGDPVTEDATVALLTAAVRDAEL
ncbi:MBL fold metallo-hydrolase [Streptomyces tsukubensis]|uniref:MBL fold metallo-hydrolase n=1 Tax=Streptomyces tsukubensis TaxID=83656 RepID=A0A1V4A0L8_9ACTN|nr:MBL fold metallo-hydrolase [Streptomyces tsukubensis]OON71769.1 MBL fold metallo-hydrolase [Streptomyces tsukubensis]QFR97046.1 MBL fold metallo-hydrolase [Streptomyces tsukubensis]